MKLRLEDKRKAIELRHCGFTHSEIRKNIPHLSKGTLSGWLKNVPLTVDQKAIISQRSSTNRKLNQLKGAWANKTKAGQRIENIRKIAEKQYLDYACNPLFIACIMLYWAEGSKSSRCFQFINSDPHLIALMMKFLREQTKVDKADIKVRLYIHETYKAEGCEKYWSSIVDIPEKKFLKTIYKPTCHKVKKNISYKGCCRIEITKSEIFWKIMRWQELLFEQIIGPRSEMDIT